MQAIAPQLSSIGLPPVTMIGPHAEKLIDILTQELSISFPSWNQADLRGDITSVIRTVVIHDDVSGLAFPCTKNNPNELLCCTVAKSLILSDSGSNRDISILLANLSQVLSTPKICELYPEINQKPRKKITEASAEVNRLANILVDLINAPAFNELGSVIYAKLIVMYGDQEWTSRLSKKSIRYLSALRRVILNMPATLARTVRQAIQNNAPDSISEQVWWLCQHLQKKKSAQEIHFNTQKGYYWLFFRFFFDLVDFCLPPGLNDQNDRDVSNRSNQNSNISEPEKVDDENSDDLENLIIEYFNRHTDRWEEQTARELNPGILGDLVELEIAKRLHHPTDDIEAKITLREDLNQLDWNCMPFIIFSRGLNYITQFGVHKPTVAGAFSTYALLSLNGLSLNHILNLRIGTRKPGEPLSNLIYDPASRQIYSPLDFWESYPKIPQYNPDYYHKCERHKLVPVWGPIADALDVLTKGREQGEFVYTRAKEDYLRLFSLLNDRANVKRPPGMQDFDERRLRNDFWLLLQKEGRLDPLWASLISGQYKQACRTPLFYTTVSAGSIASAYYTSINTVVNHLTEHYSLRLPASFKKDYQYNIPDLYTGSPYRPLDNLVVEAIAKINAAISSTTDPIETHNLKTLRVILFLLYLFGCRKGEVFLLDRANFEFDIKVTSHLLSFLRLPDDLAKGNQFFSAGRLIPLVDWVIAEIRDVINHPYGPGAFYWIGPEGAVPFTENKFHRMLKDRGVDFGRFPDSRHWLRSTLVEHHMSFEAINLIMGHESGSQAPYTRWGSPYHLSAWVAFLLNISKIAIKYGWI